MSEAHSANFETSCKGWFAMKPTFLHKQGEFIYKQFVSQEVDLQSDKKRDFANTFMYTHAQDNGLLFSFIGK